MKKNLLTIWNILFGCQHKHLMFDNVNGVKGLRCANENCFEFFPFTRNLTYPTGVYLRIESRIDLEKREQELAEIAKQVQPYV